MELSNQVNDILSKVKQLQRQSDESVCGKISLSKDYELILCRDDDFINVDEMDFSNDETWLCESDMKSDIDISKWLYENATTRARSETPDRKALDTRTYTRPKKRFLRPSIEQFNEQYSEAARADDALSQEIQNYMASTAITSNVVDSTKPLFFDLSQPASCTIFDNIIMSSSINIDSFQNMSPPSLVNSMCSSTFTNLMENSYIKNDPVLREIRDADYSNEVLMQDGEPQLYQSFTESCSSLNSDCAELFLKRTLPNLSATITKDTTSDSETSNITMILKEASGDTLCNSNNLNTSYIVESNLNNTFKKNITKDISCDMSSSNNSDIQNNLDVPNGIKKDFDEDPEPNVVLNCTFEKNSSNSSATDIVYNSAKSDPPKSKDVVVAYDKAHSENIDPNTTLNTPPTPKPKPDGTFRARPNAYGTYKKHQPVLGGRTEDATAHLNQTISLGERLEEHAKDRSYIVTSRKEDEDSFDEPLDRTVDVKRRSGSFATGSTDSLEHGSSRSNSSGGSSRVLNMAEVDAIVEFQERSLQIMSTPKPAISMSKLFESEDLSPILRQKEHVSDSDLSSTEDYLTGRSTLSKSSGHSERHLRSPERPVKSMHNLKHAAEPKVETQRRGLNIPRPAAARGLRGSYSNLRMPDAAPRGSYSNLTTMRPALKGSYTSLKPISQNLPVITSAPPSRVNVTQNLVQNDHVFKIPIAPPRQCSAPVNIEKSQARSSCLPRPVTSIPRPTSKIPAPRTNRLPVMRGGSQPVSKVSLNQEHY